MARENSVVPAIMACAVLGAPSDWMTASTPVTAFNTAVASSASPAILLSLLSSTAIWDALRAKARTVCPSDRARLTVSRPMPWLAPITSRVAIAAIPRAQP